ncbi:MAG: trypsin-like peptidase domain-containing protein, partial [Pirellulaceae bacterium]
MTAAIQPTLFRFLMVLFVGTAIQLSAAPLQAQQLTQEMQELFQQMLPQLDSDLKQKVQEALDTQRDYLELTPDQFKRFRDHPANPFEGWQGIDPDSIQGLIRLQFETQPIRSRQPGRFERQSSQMLSQYSNVVSEANASTVIVTDGKTQIAFGTVVTNEGHVATKLSEVRGKDELFCKSHDGQRFTAELVAENVTNDVAILKIADGAMPPVRFAAAQPVIGGFTFSASGNPVPLAFGVYSNPPRSLIGKNQAFLGVKPVDHVDGVRVTEVTEESAAD